MLQKFFVFFMFIWPVYYTKIIPDYSNTEKHLIAGGYVPAKHTHAKYAVSIADLDSFDINDPKQFGAGHFCGGSIIGLQTILTAAHCVYKDKAKRLVVIAGTPRRTKRYRSTQILYVSKIVTHPEFNSSREDTPHDIALLHLRTKILEDPVATKRIKFSPKSYAKQDEKCLLVGWGQLGDDAANADELQYVDLVVFKKEVCDKTIPAIEKTFCAGNKFGKIGGGCPGESGGPLFCKGQLSGIDIIGKNCSEPGPTFFTDVSKYYDWIKQNSLDKIDYKSAAQNNSVDNILLKITGLIILFINVFV